MFYAYKLDALKNAFELKKKIEVLGVLFSLDVCLCVFPFTFFPQCALF